MSDQPIKFDPKLEEGIAYFEQMLQAMPDDRTTLEFLCVAYEQIGELEKCRKAFISLAGVLLKEKDFESAERIAERLDTYQESDAKAMALKVRAAQAPAPALVPDVPTGIVAPPSALSIVFSAGVKGEKALAHKLATARIIDEKMSDNICSHLDGLPFADRPFMVSALQIIEKENPAMVDQILAYIADTGNTPPIPLASFELSKDLIKTFPEDIVRVRGTIPFAKVGDTVLVTTLNPFDDDLKREIEIQSGSQCRFYLVDPQAVEDTLNKLYTVEVK